MLILFLRYVASSALPPHKTVTCRPTSAPVYAAALAPLLLLVLSLLWSTSPFRRFTRTGFSSHLLPPAFSPLPPPTSPGPSREVLFTHTLLPFVRVGPSPPPLQAWPLAAAPRLSRQPRGDLPSTGAAATSTSTSTPASTTCCSPTSRGESHTKGNPTVSRGRQLHNYNWGGRPTARL